MLISLSDGCDAQPITRQEFLLIISFPSQLKVLLFIQTEQNNAFYYYQNG
jgi:hypothetical protein